jgi:hypothetical protein
MWRSYSSGIDPTNATVLMRLLSHMFARMTLDPARERLIRALPKVELHLHIEGTLEPEMMFSLAAKHGVKLPYATVEDVRRAYNFHDLQSCLLHARARR